MSEQELYMVIREFLQQYNLIFDSLRDIEKDLQENRTIYSDKFTIIKEQLISAQGIMHQILDAVCSGNVSAVKIEDINLILTQVKSCTEANHDILVRMGNIVDKIIWKIIAASVGLGAAATILGLILHKAIPWIETLFKIPV